MPLKVLSIRASFQAKVLIPVIGLMALLLVLTIALVMHRVTAQFQEDATRKLLTAEAIFQNSHKIRARNLLQRYGGVLNEPRFKAAAQTDPATLRASLAELLEEVGGNAAFFSTEDAGATSRASRDPQLEVKD